MAFSCLTQHKATTTDWWALPTARAISRLADHTTGSCRRPASITRIWCRRNRSAPASKWSTSYPNRALNRSTIRPIRPDCAPTSLAETWLPADRTTSTIRRPMIFSAVWVETDWPFRASSRHCRRAEDWATAAWVAIRPASSRCAIITMFRKVSFKFYSRAFNKCVS